MTQGFLYLIRHAQSGCSHQLKSWLCLISILVVLRKSTAVQKFEERPDVSIKVLVPVYLPAHLFSPTLPFLLPFHWELIQGLPHASPVPSPCVFR